MSKKLLSIVIPAYNSEPYLERCLNSLLVGSVMDKTEVLVINDGSKDRTSEIAHSYENRYPQYIRAIDKDNGNYGSVMNVGLSLAQGKYFRTLDSDDWYDSDAFCDFVRELESTDADMLLCSRQDFFESKSEMIKLHLPDVPLSKDVDVKDAFWENENLIPFESVTCLCYKTEILKLSGLKWSEKVFYSDTEYDFWPLKLVKSVRFVPLPVYVYLIGRNDQSMSMANIKKNFHSFYIVANKITDEFIKVAEPDSGVYSLQKKYLGQILGFCYRFLFVSNEHDEEIKKLDNKLHSIGVKLTHPSLYYYRINIVDAFRKHGFVYKLCLWHNKCISGKESSFFYSLITRLFASFAKLYNLFH